MKKLLVLMLVLGMASLANAVYDLALDGDDAATLTGDGVYTGFYISAITGTVDMDILFTGAGTGATPVVNQGIIDYATGLLGATPTDLWLVAFVDSTAPPDNVLPDGIVATFAGNLMPVTVTLHNQDTFAIMEQVTLTPEPMSLMLLGLGGLFLRRRK